MTTILIMWAPILAFALGIVPATLAVGRRSNRVSSAPMPAVPMAPELGMYAQIAHMHCDKVLKMASLNSPGWGPSNL